MNRIHGKESARCEISCKKIAYFKINLLEFVKLLLNIGPAFPIGTLKVKTTKIYKYTNILLAECEVRAASYGPSFFLSFMAQARSARAMKTRKEKTRIHNLPYGLSKRG